MNTNNQIDFNSAKKFLSKKYYLFRKPVSICKSEKMFLPYYQFDCSIKMNNKTDIIPIAIDSFYGECAIVNSSTCTQNINDKICNCAINVKEAETIVKRFIIYEILYMKSKGLEIPIIEISYVKTFLYPYWIGYYKKGINYDIEIIDGYTGQKQGPKMKKVFINYLIHQT